MKPNKIIYTIKVSRDKSIPCGLEIKYVRIIDEDDNGRQYRKTVKYMEQTVTTSYKLSELLDEKRHNIYKVDTLEEAVKTAYSVTAKGMSCLLSPAAASYEAFKNFEEKGRKYKEYIDIYK